MIGTVFYDSLLTSFLNWILYLAIQSMIEKLRPIKDMNCFQRDVFCVFLETFLLTVN